MLILYIYIIVELNGIFLLDMNMFCFFRFFLNKLRNPYPALCKLLSKSKSGTVSDSMCIPDSEIISQIVWPGSKRFYMPNSCIRAERVTMGKKPK